MKTVVYTGTNYDEVKRLCGDKVLAPYFCMGFSMLSVDTGDGFVSVNEGDTIVREDDGSSRVVSTTFQDCSIIPSAQTAKT